VEIVVFLFALCAITHCIDVYRKARRVAHWEIPTNGIFPKISVVVCAHNEADNLRELAPLLKNQDYPNLEVIVVLDRCTDGSSQVLKGFEGVQFSVLSLANTSAHFHPKKFGISQAIEWAQCEWALLTDADCRPGLQWVSEMANGMQPNKDVVIGLSPYKKEKGLLNVLIQYETFTTALHFVSAALNGKTYMGLGRNLAYRKSTFLEKQGFGPEANRMGGDDDLLVQQLATPTNVSLILTKDSFVDSIPESTWSSYIRQKTRHFSVSGAYNKASKRSETWRWSIHLLMWLLFPLSLFVNWQLTVVIFVGSFLMKAISINIVAGSLEKRFNHLWIPFVDLAYVVFLPLISLRSLLVKRITWK
jgi:biofilm PGA synthesis N-glycosyltransferase PgaC